MNRPVTAYIWLYLLVRMLVNPKDRVTRAELAEELTPGMPTEKQRTRLRNRLSDLQHGSLPPALLLRLVLDGDDALALDLTRSRIDLLTLEEVAARCAGKEGLLPPDLAREASAMLDQSMGGFMSGWEQLESAVNGGRGSAGELVRALRQRAETARLDVMSALAANLARREPRRAIPILEQALERQPDREDLARQLRAAYLETGQLARAAELQKDHALDV